MTNDTASSPVEPAAAQPSVATLADLIDAYGHSGITRVQGPVEDQEPAEYRIRIEPDGSLVVIWKEPLTSSLMASNSAAILADRDSAVSNLLRALVRGIRAGVVR